MVKQNTLERKGDKAMTMPRTKDASAKQQANVAGAIFASSVASLLLARLPASRSRPLAARQAAKKCRRSARTQKAVLAATALIRAATAFQAKASPATTPPHKTAAPLVQARVTSAPRTSARHALALHAMTAFYET